MTEQAGDEGLAAAASTSSLLEPRPSRQSSRRVSFAGGDGDVLQGAEEDSQAGPRVQRATLSSSAIVSPTRAASTMISASLRSGSTEMARMRRAKSQVARNKKLARSGSKVADSNNEFLEVLEAAFELSHHLQGDATISNRVFDWVFGTLHARAEPCDPGDINDQQAEGAGPASRGFELGPEDSLERSLCRTSLGAEAWVLMNRRSRLNGDEMMCIEQLQRCKRSLYHWFEATLRDVRIEPARALDPGEESDEYLGGVLLLDSFKQLYDKLFATLRPCLATLETFNEQRDPMNELMDLDHTTILMCIDSVSYLHIETECTRALLERNEFKPVDLTKPGFALFKEAGQVEAMADQVQALQKAQDDLKNHDDAHLVFDGLEKSEQRSLERARQHEGNGDGRNRTAGILSVVQNHREKVRSKHARPDPGPGQPGARRQHRYSVTSLFGSSNDKIRAYVQKRTMSLLFVEQLIDSVFATTALLVLRLALAEALKKKANVARILAEGHSIGSFLATRALPLMERCLDFESEILSVNIMNLTRRRLTSVSGPDAILHRVVHKLRVANSILAAMDVCILPRTFATHRGTVRSLALSHLDPNIVLTSGDDKMLRIWDLCTGACMAAFAGHKSIIPWCRFTSDDQLIVSCSFDTTIKVWDSKSGRCRSTLTGHLDSILDADLSSNDRLVVSASMDGTVRLWSIHSGVCYRIYRGHEDKAWVKCVAFLPDGAGILSAGLDNRLVLWKLEPPPTAEAAAKLASHSSPFTTESESKAAVTADRDRAAKHALEQVTPAYVWTDLHSNYVLDIAMLGAKDSTTRTTLMLTASKDATQQLVDIDLMMVRKTFTPSITRSGSGSMRQKSSRCVNSDGCNDDDEQGTNDDGGRQAYIWANTVSFSPDGRFIAMGYFENTVTILTAHNFVPLRTLRVHNKGISRILFTRDAKFVLVGCDDGKLQILPL